MYQNKYMEKTLSSLTSILNLIISFPYSPYILVIFFAIITIILLPVITLISTINKVSRLYDSKKYTDVIRLLEKYFKSHKYEKTLLSFLYESYLKLNNKQKALHYMQVAIERGFIKDKYVKMFHNTKMAQILFELNQTTESFEKLYEVINEGEYEANWCHLFGKIFLSQQQFENALYYLERAVFISKKSIDILFDYNLTLFFKLKDKTLTNCIEIFIKNAKKEAVFIIASVYIFKKDYSNARLWLTKASFSNDAILECYRKFLILYCSYSIIKDIDTQNIDMSRINAEKTEFLISLNNALKSDSLDSIKSKLLENSIYLIKLLNDQQNLNYFLITARTNYSLFTNLDEAQIFSESKIENFIKRIQQGIILLDIFGYTTKKVLIPPADFVKKEFEHLKPTASQSEQLRKKILSQYLRLTDRGFVKVNLRVVRLFEYIPTKIRSRFEHSKGIASLRVLATEIEYPHKLALFIFRRTNSYDLTYRLFELINQELEDQNIDTCFFFYNFPLDSDAEKYVNDFPKITVYDQAHLALFLEESMKVEKNRS